MNYEKILKKRLKKESRKKRKGSFLKKGIIIILLLVICIVLGGFAYANFPKISSFPWLQEKKEEKGEIKEVITEEAKPVQETVEEKSISVKLEGTEVSMPVRQYLVGCLAYQMQASYPSEALKAQAILCRTNLYINIREGTIPEHPYLASSEPAYIQAVKDTEQLCLLQEGEMVPGYFHANTAGTTLNCSEAGISGAYLKKANVIGEDNSEVFGNTAKRDVLVSPEDFKTIIGDKAGSFEMTLEDIRIKSSDAEGRVEIFGIGGYEFSGEDISNLYGLNTTNFTLGIENNMFIFRCKGYGKPVGVSQNSAKILAEEGKTAPEIINFFYQNIEIEKVDI